MTKNRRMKVMASTYKLFFLAVSTMMALRAQPLPPATYPPSHPHTVETTVDIYTVDKKGNVASIPVDSYSYTQLYAQIAAYGALAGLDYRSTQRGLNNRPYTGREANPFLSCNGGDLCVGRFVVLNAAAGAGIAIVGRFVTPALPKTPRRIVNSMVWAMLGGRTAVVVSNYRKGGR